MEDFEPFFKKENGIWRYYVSPVNGGRLPRATWISGKYFALNSGKFHVETWSVEHCWDTPSFVVATEQEAKDALITAYVQMRLDGWTP